MIEYDDQITVIKVLILHLCNDGVIDMYFILPSLYQKHTSFTGLYARACIGSNGVLKSQKVLK